MAFLKRFFSENLHNPSLFRTVYIVNLFFCSVCFWNIAGVAVNVLSFLWSLVILVDMFLVRKNFRCVKQFAVIMAFLAAGLYTVLINIDSNFAVNFVMLYHAAICFFLFYGMHSEPDREKVRAEINLALKLIVYLSTALAAIGLMFVLFAPTGRLYFGGYVFGIMDNRFTGVYTNPNLAAFSSVAGMACCHILMKRNRPAVNGRRALPLWVMISCFAANTISLLLSDSNSSLVFAVVYICVYLFCRFYQKNAGSFSKKTVVCGATLVLCCGLIAGSSLGFRTVSQAGVSKLINATDNMRVFAGFGMGSGTDKQEGADGRDIEIGRLEDYELSSGRIDSLKKSMVLFERFPLLGVGKGNIVPYGEKYIVDGFAFHDLHNGYLTILISNGIVGLVAFMAFILMFGKRLVRFLRRNRSGNLKEFPALVAALVAYCVFGLFEKAILFDITFMVMIFWMLMGHTASFLAEHEWQEDTVENRSAIPVGGYYRPGYAYTYILSAYQNEVVRSFSDVSGNHPSEMIGYKRFHYQQGLSPPRVVQMVKMNQGDMRAEISSFSTKALIPK